MRERTDDGKKVVSAGAPQMFFGVTLVQVAGVTAGLSAGLPKETVFRNEGVLPTQWEDAQIALEEALLVEHEGELQDSFESALESAQRRYHRTVTPLDKNPNAWADFLRAFWSSASPMRFLAQLGMRASDICRLQQHWAQTTAADATLKELLRAAMDKPTEPLPEIQIGAWVADPPPKVYTVEDAPQDASEGASPSPLVTSVPVDEPHAKKKRLPKTRPTFPVFERRLLREEASAGGSAEKHPSRRTAPRLTPEFSKPAVNAADALPAAPQKSALPSFMVQPSQALSASTVPTPPPAIPSAPAVPPVPARATAPQPAVSTQPHPSAPRAAPFPPQTASVGVDTLTFDIRQLSPELAEAVKKKVLPFAQKRTDEPTIETLDLAPDSVTLEAQPSPLAKPPLPFQPGTQPTPAGVRPPGVQSQGVPSSASAPAAPPKLPVPRPSSGFENVPAKIFPAPAPQGFSAPAKGQPRSARWDEATLEALPSPIKAALPFANKAAASAQRDLPAGVPATVEQHAAMCAELAVFPGKADSIFARSGLADPFHRSAFDKMWKERLQKNVSEKRVWDEHYRRSLAQFQKSG